MRQATGNIRIRLRVLHPCWHPIQITLGRKNYEICLSNVQASDQNDDPPGIRWINSDLIGFTIK